MPEMRFGFEAFFSPPLFGLLSALTGLITKSSKELSVGQALFRKLLQLLSIEVIVFGANYLAGTVFESKLKVTLALAIALVYVLVYLIMWLNDRRSANLFNERLKAYQQEMYRIDDNHANI